MYELVSSLFETLYDASEEARSVAAAHPQDSLVALAAQDVQNWCTEAFDALSVRNGGYCEARLREARALAADTLPYSCAFSIPEALDEALHTMNQLRDIGLRM